LREQKSTADVRSLPRRQVVITFVGVLLAIFLSSLDQTIVATAMPDIISSLGGFSHYTFVSTSYLVSSTVLIPITGRLTDLFGRKWFYTSGIIIFILGSFLSGQSQTLTQLIVFRALQGVGAGIMISSAFAVIGDLFQPAERGKYQGFVSGVFGISSVVGPSLGGFITDNFSWHWIFYINIPIGLAVILLFVFFFPNVRPGIKTFTVDYPGIASLVLSVVPFLLALSWGGVEYAWNSPIIIGMFIFSVIMAGVLYLVETRSEEPILPLQYFWDRTVSISMAVTLLTGFGMFGSIVFVPLYYQGGLGLSATASGNFLTPMLLGVVIGSLSSGQILSRFGGHYRVQGIIGNALMAIGLGLFSSVTLQTGYTASVVYIVIIGLGLGITFPLYTIAVQNAVPYRVMGVVVSSIPFSRFIGGAFGLAILGSLLSHHFAVEFMSSLPASIGSAIPPEQLSALAHNPQALISPQAQTQLMDLLMHLQLPLRPDFDQIILALRQSLVSAIREVFLIAFVVTLVALVISFFIKEIPLRKKQDSKPLG
jgi:EmrB/QacA subfamily drug resistance transporter